MTNEPSLKNQAENIMTAIDRDVQQVAEAQPSATLQEIDARAGTISRLIYGAISDVDLKAATAKVQRLREKYPNASPQDLSQMLIREKCQKTGTVGAVTSGAGLIPGIGTAAALTLGTAADIGATFKLQAEMVLEIAAVYNYPLSEAEKQRIVLGVTGISAGTTALVRKAGQVAALKASEKAAGKAVEKSLLKALPLIGIMASAGTNVLSTYIIGYRADVYFRLGPEHVGTWADNLRAISGIDERKIGGWLADSSKSAGQAVVWGTSKVAGTVGPAVSSGVKTAGGKAKSGARAYGHWLVVFWAAIFGFIGGIFHLIWLAISFIPRKIIGLFRCKKQPVEQNLE
jgi:hypothetical protein